MSGNSFYNENDAQKAAWLRELIRENVIALGEVDERSIAELEPADLRGYTQCHFFAGIGVWSYALRLAGWPDDRPVWTGSCPCPSFSCAGKGRGFDDPRHLWPTWFGLIRECQPATVFGEQADDAIEYGWLDLVQTDLEGEAYAVGKAVLGACSVGAPHIRQRLYFCAHAQHAERRTECQIDGNAHGRDGLGRSGDIQPSADAAGSRRQDARQYDGRQPSLPARSEQCSGVGDPADAAESGRRTRFNGDDARESDAERRGSAGLSPNGRLPSDRNLQRSGEQRLLAEDCGTGKCEHARCDEPRTQSKNNGDHGEAALGEMRTNDNAIVLGRAGATSGFWRDCDWWYGRDGKYRPIEPGLFPLAHGATHRVLKLRGYGDAIVPQLAAEFIQAAREVIDHA